MHEVRLTPVQASYVKGLQSHLLSKCSRRDTPSFGSTLPSNSGGFEVGLARPVDLDAVGHPAACT